jgi:hypothetical protein
VRDFFSKRSLKNQGTEKHRKIKEKQHKKLEKQANTENSTRPRGDVKKSNKNKKTKK